jgi:hypothetical protein
VNKVVLVEAVNKVVLVEAVNTVAHAEKVNIPWLVNQAKKDVLVLKMGFVIVVQTVNVLHAIDEIISKI